MHPPPPAPPVPLELELVLELELSALLLPPAPPPPGGGPEGPHPVESAVPALTIMSVTSDAAYLLKKQSNQWFFDTKHP